MPPTGLTLGIAATLALLWNETAAVGELPPGTPPDAGGDWPMYRHDLALTAVSPLRGVLR